MKPSIAATSPTGTTEWSPHAVLSYGRWVTTIVGLLAVTLAAMVGCLGFGADNLGLAETARTLFKILRSGEWDRESLGTSAVILLQVRLPRVLLAVMVGGALASVGVALQALLRNPLADPYVLGISSGAALGASVAMLLGIGATTLGLYATPLYAFAGGLLSILLAYRIAVTHGRLPVHTLLLTGVILNAVFSALIMFVTSIMDPNRSYGLLFWLMGSLTSSSYSSLGALAVYLIVGIFVLAAQSTALNLLTLGEESARTLGVEVENLKKVIFVTAALITGAVVSLSGVIGFIGMVVPHAVRIIFGADHRLLLPASVLLGGTSLLVADTIARTVLAPNEIPVGVVTALVGGPVFIYLLSRRRGVLA